MLTMDIISPGSEAIFWARTKYLYCFSPMMIMEKRQKVETVIRIPLVVKHAWDTVGLFYPWAHKGAERK